MLLRLLCILSFSAAAFSMPIADAGGDYSLLPMTPVDQAPTSTQVAIPAPMKPETVSPDLQDASGSPANDFPVFDLGGPVPAPITSAPTDDGTAKVEKMMDSMVTPSGTLDPSVQSANLPPVAPPCNTTDPTGTIPLSPPVSPVSTMSSTQLAEPGTVGVDGKCTTSNDCAPGNCCSEFGFCGNTSDFCNARSKPPVSAPCPNPLPAVDPLSPPVSPVLMMSSTQLPGQGTVGVDGKCTTSNECAPGNCCSEFGFCGNTSDFCNASPKPPVLASAVDGKCNTSSDCAPGSCCSEFGFCGNTIEFCNTRSKPPVSIPCPNPLPAVNDPASSLPPPPSAPSQAPVNPAPANCPCANPPVTTVPSTPPVSLPTTVPGTDPLSFASIPVSNLDSPMSPPPTGEVVGNPPSTLPADVPVSSPTTLPSLTPTSSPADCETNKPDQLNASLPLPSNNDPNLLTPPQQLIL